MPGGGHIYSGRPDDRQSDDVAMPTSRFRPRYRALSPEEKALHDEIKAQAEVLEKLYDRMPAGRYLSLAHTELELSVMWAIKHLTA